MAPRAAVPIPSGWLVALAVTTLVGCAQVLPTVDSGPIAGRYDALSESDWALSLILQSDGRALIEHTWWEPGEHGDTVLKRTPGRWELSGSEVILSYQGVTDTLRYSPRLSLSDVGGSGRRPGLMGVAPVDRHSLIGIAKLWRQPD
jgi:hypothetical protein